QLTKYAAGYTPPKSSLTVGEPFDTRSAVPIGEEYSIAITPSGEQVGLDPTTPLALNEVGFYELRNPRTASQPIFVAVNVDADEANLSVFDTGEMSNALLAATDETARTAAGAGLTLAERERQQSGWWYLIVAAFLFLVGETLFS